MASFAKLNNENIVIEVQSISNEVVKDSNGIEQEEIGVQFLKSLYGQDTIWKQTSYNTLKNTHKLNDTPFRKNFAGIGYTYDETRDAFIPPEFIYNGQICHSWVLNENTCNYECPVPFPETYNLNLRSPKNELLKDTYSWNESTLTWDLDNGTN
jgi:hypothetical protein